MLHNSITYGMVAAIIAVTGIATLQHFAPVNAAPVCDMRSNMPEYAMTWAMEHNARSLVRINDEWCINK